MVRNHALKNHLVAFLGEFVGTFLFLFFSFAGTQVAVIPSTQDQVALAGPDTTTLMYVSLIFALSLTVNVWIFFRVSGGLFNPVVTMSFVILGIVTPVRGLFVFVAQIVGSIAAAGLAYGIIPGNSIAFNNELMHSTSITQGLFLEMFMTAELVFTVLMLAAEKTKATFIAPIGIGLSLFISMLIGTYWTGACLNPARAFGPDVFKGFYHQHWVYWIGPILGSLLATGFYALLKFLNYEEVNGDQDKTEVEKKEVGTEQTDDADASGLSGNTYDNDHNNNQRHHSRGTDLKGSQKSARDTKLDGYHNSNGYHDGRHYQANDYAANQEAGQANSQGRIQRTGQTQERIGNRSNRNSQSSSYSAAMIPEPPTLEERQQQFRYQQARQPQVPLDINGDPYFQDVDALDREERNQQNRRKESQGSRKGDGEVSLKSREDRIMDYRGERC